MAKKMEASVNITNDKAYVQFISVDEDKGSREHIFTADIPTNLMVNSIDFNANVVLVPVTHVNDYRK